MTASISPILSAFLSFIFFFFEWNGKDWNDGINIVHNVSHILIIKIVCTKCPLNHFYFFHFYHLIILIIIILLLLFLWVVNSFNIIVGNLFPFLFILSSSFWMCFDSNDNKSIFRQTREKFDGKQTGCWLITFFFFFFLF